MDFIRGLHNLPARARGCALTIGNFDGLHRGHQALIAQARRRADEFAVPLTVLCFEPTPREYFSPDGAPPRVATLRTKLADFADAGVDRVVVQRFGKPFAALSPRAFSEQVLVQRLRARAVIVGDDFSFGTGRSGTLDTLRTYGTELGFSVDGVAAVQLAGQRCSSTALRAALAQPDLAAASELRGRPYHLVGKISRGLQLGRTLNMPTANINLRRRPALCLGVYAVTAQLDGDARQWPGVASIGVRPTLGITRCLLETHLFDNPGDIYGRRMTVQFRQFLRSEERFDSLDALQLQMQRDKLDAMAFLGVATDNC